MVDSLQQYVYFISLVNYSDILIGVILTHVAHSPHPASDELPLRHCDCQPQVRNTDVSCSRVARWFLIHVFFKKDY